MFRKIASLLTDQSRGQREERIGFLVSRELEECAAEIMQIFKVDRFIHDSEDTWEWVEGDGVNGVHVNMSRPHEEDSGVYSLPIVIRISGPNETVSKPACEGWAQQLADVLKTEVWIGDVVSEEDDASQYNFEVEDRFVPRTQA